MSRLFLQKIGQPMRKRRIDEIKHRTVWFAMVHLGSKIHSNQFLLFPLQMYTYELQ